MVHSKQSNWKWSFLPTATINVFNNKPIEQIKSCRSRVNNTRTIELRFWTVFIWNPNCHIKGPFSNTSQKNYSTLSPPSQLPMQNLIMRVAISNDIIIPGAKPRKHQNIARQQSLWGIFANIMVDEWYPQNK